MGTQSLVSTVRAAGARIVLIVGGLDWANDVSGWLAHQPKDPEEQLVASWHSYRGESCDTPTCWGATVAPVAAKVPVVTGEVGDSVCFAGSYAATLLPWADPHGMSYLGWAWNTWATGTAF